MLAWVNPIKYVLLAENEALLRFASGTTHQTIYYPEAKAFHVCLPPREEQINGIESIAYGINANGQVVGRASIVAHSPEHAFLYTGGVMTDLGTLGGGVTSLAWDINTDGQIVGQAYTEANASRAFLYGDVMVDLNSLIDPLSGWELISATGINDSGQITGFGEIGGQTHAFILTPIPEPSSFVLAALGLIGLVVWRRRKR